MSCWFSELVRVLLFCTSVLVGWEGTHGSDTRAKSESLRRQTRTALCGRAMRAHPAGVPPELLGGLVLAGPRREGVGRELRAQFGVQGGAEARELALCRGAVGDVVGPGARRLEPPPGGKPWIHRVCRPAIDALIAHVCAGPWRGVDWHPAGDVRRLEAEGPHWSAALAPL